MSASLVLLTLSSMAVFGSAFMSAPSTRLVSSLQMKVKGPSVGNLPRKIKRTVRSSDATNFVSNICTPEYDKFLKEEAEGGVYVTIMKKITEAANRLGVKVSADFGAKPVVVLPTIVETAVKAGSFNTLVAAVTAAGLANTLGTDVFTVFAPTDEAFAKLPEGTVEGLLADVPALTSTLTYHVLAGRFNSKKLTAEKELKFPTVNGGELTVKLARDGEVTINGAKLLTKDIKCSNGFIHVVDTVLIPK